MVPELAGHRLVHLVEALAVVGEDTAPHLVAQAQPELPEPVGVRQALPGGRDDVRHAGPEQLLRLLEGRDAARQDDRRPAPRGAHRLPHGADGLPVPAERSSLVRPHGRHALVATGPGVGIAGPAHPRLLGVLELAPAREREVVHPGPRKLGSEPGRILGGVASRNAFLGQEPAPHHESLAHRASHRAVDLERQLHPIRAGSAVAIIPLVQRGEKRRHGVGVGVVQLHAIEPRLLGTCRRSSEQSRQYPWQLPNVRQLGIGDPLPLAESQALELPLIQELGPLRLRQSRQRLPDGVVGAWQQGAVPVGEDQELPEVSLRLRPAADPEEVDDLDEQPSPSAARLADGAHQLGQAGDEPVVPDPEERSAGNVPDSGGLDDQRPGLPPRETLVPRQDLRRDQPVVGGPPGHHGRNPGALASARAGPSGGG